MDVTIQNTETGCLTAEIQRLKIELECKAPRQFHYGDALGFLRAVYNNEGLPLTVRLDAARTAIKYETPSLSAVAVSDKGPSIAEQLAEGRKRAEQQQMEARALSTQDQKLKMIS